MGYVVVQTAILAIFAAVVFGSAVVLAYKLLGWLID